MNREGPDQRQQKAAVSPWDPDRELTPRQASAAISLQFHQVDTRHIELLGSGWEYDAYRTRDGWVFRFPRRREYAEAFTWERGIQELVVERILPVRVPRISLLGEPGPHFPYAFAGHRYIPGVSADHPEVQPAPTLARELGETLSRIHAVPESAARSRDVKHDPDGAKEWLEDVRQYAGSLRGVDRRVDSGLEWLHSRVAVPAADSGPLRFIHNDLCPDHILVDPDSGRLSGIIDWTDAALADPAFDFTVLVAWRGWTFFEMVRSAYSVELDPEFEKRVAFLARVQSLDWLWESRERGTDLGKHIRWIHNAFSAPEPS